MRVYNEKGFLTFLSGGKSLEREYLVSRYCVEMKGLQ